MHDKEVAWRPPSEAVDGNVMATGAPVLRVRHGRVDRAIGRLTLVSASPFHQTRLAHAHLEAEILVTQVIIENPTLDLPCTVPTRNRLLCDDGSPWRGEPDHLVGPRKMVGSACPGWRTPGRAG